MQDIKVHRYAHPKAVGWAGWLEPKDRSWIAFIGLDGHPIFFLNRDPETGAILGDADSPEERAKHIAYLRARTMFNGRHIGEPSDGSATYPEGERDPHELGEPIHPLGESGGGGDVVPRRA